MALAETAELAVRISLKDNVSAGVRGLQKNLGGLNRSLAQTGRGVGQIGAGLTRAGLVVGGAAVAGIVATAKAAIDFQDAFAGVRKTVNEADLTAVGLSFESLALSFRKMATEMPIAATDLARIGEAAGALGIKATDIEEFTKTVALLGVTTNLTTDVAAEDLGKLGTILNLTGKDFTAFADTLVNLGNQGASTESEIIEVTKRFAAMGKQAGLTTNEILALASTATSLGAEPEAAGSALSRIFSNMSTNIALADKKGQAFSKITAGVFGALEKLDEAGGGSHVIGQLDEKAAAELKDLKAAIQRGDALPVLQKFLGELGKLDRLDAAKALKEAGITNVRDRNAILLMSQNIAEVNRQLEVAQNSTGALGKEAQKRFDTIASKIQVLKNNLKEAAIEVGEGFLPALGRATEKLTKFLQLDANKSRLKNLGEEIGRSIDSIDWNAVLTAADQFVGLLKGALSFAKLMYDAFSTLPGPIKEATAGFLVLNKLSGGLIGAGAGNIVAGLGGAALQGAGSRLPGLGRLFAQPVYVVNFPPGFGGLGGAGGAAAAAGAIGTGTALVAIAAAATVSYLATAGFADKNTVMADKGLNAAEIAAVKYYQSDTAAQQVALKHLGSIPTVADFKSGLFKLQTGTGETFGPPSPFAKTPVRPTVVDSPRTSPVNMAEIEAAIARGRAKGFSPSFEAAQETVQRNASRAAERQAAAAASLISSAAVQQRAGERLSLPLIVPAPNVTVNVSPVGIAHTVTFANRAGPAGSSRETSKRFET